MTPILFIAYHFPPIGGAGVQRSQKFVRYLPTEGFLPIVVTGPGAVEDRWSPNDAELSREFDGEVQVSRASGPVPRSNGKWGTRLERWLGRRDEFSKWWMSAGMEAASRSLNGAKLIFATMSPFSTAGFARDLARQRNVPWVADLRDPWALDEMQIYPSGFHRLLDRRHMQQWLSSAAGIVMNTPEATAALQEAFPSFKKKILTTITNGYDQADFNTPLSPTNEDKFRIVHTGYLHTGMGLQLRKRRRVYQLLGGIDGDVDILTRSHVLFLKAVERWISRDPQVAQHVEIVLAGVASAEDKAAVMKSDAAGLIRFTEYLSHSASVELIRTANLLFLPMHNLPKGRRARVVPGKTYEYMATGRPILAAVPEGDARDFLIQAGTGLLCKPDDVDGMVQHLDDVYTAWKHKKLPVTPNWDFIKRFERSRLTRRLASFFDQVLGNHQR
jgi:glycosyltransferase involved in cell wall biosynthesis